MLLSTLFWSRWMMSVLPCIVHPHSCMPVGLHRLHYLFVQHQLVMYRRGRSSSHEPIHFFYFSPSSSRFFLTCAFQCSLAFGMRTFDLILRYAFACSYFSGRYLSVRWLEVCFPHTHEYHRKAETAPASIRYQVTQLKRIFSLDRNPPSGLQCCGWTWPSLVTMNCMCNSSEFI